MPSAVGRRNSAARAISGSVGRSLRERRATRGASRLQSAVSGADPFGGRLGGRSLEQHIEQALGGVCIEQQSSMSGAQEALADHVIEPGEQTVEVAGRVEQADGFGVQAELRPGEDLE